MPKSRWGMKCLPLLAAFATGHATAQDAASGLLDLSIEELSNLHVTSASRVEEKLRDAAAAVFVITADDIRRSGVTNIPEALRLAPGVEVARMSSHSWAISIRGFNSDITNKLLVLIDGRSVYSPLYAGVFWDVQDTLLEDIDRIEVISGPGGTLWGANAFNGVINIITRPAAETMGGFAELGGGEEDQIVAGLRFGGSISEDAVARFYVKYVDRDSTDHAAGGDSLDSMTMARGGFRLDWGHPDSDRFTIQGDIYDGREPGDFQDPFTIGTLPAGTFRDATDLSGANLLGRWTRPLSEDSDLSLQVYYDHTGRDIPATYGESRDTFDLDFQHHRRLGTRNDFLWGVGFRDTRDHIKNTLFATFSPDHRNDQTLSFFIQDKIALQPEKLFLTLGSKFEDNDYSGSELQPNVRLAWLISERQTFWSSVSRAVRIPSRLDVDLELMVPLAIPGLPPVYVSATGNDDFQSEELLAYEAGYRVQASEHLSFDFAAFHNEYDRLSTVEPQPPIFVLVPPLPYIILPNLIENQMQGHSTGGTFVTNWQPVPGWRLRFQYAYIDLDLTNGPNSSDPSSIGLAGNGPKHQYALHSFVDLPHDFSFYAGVRHVGPLPNQDVHSYTAVDVNLGWRPRKNLEASLAVRNLTDDSHFEFGASSEIERNAYLKINWNF